MQNVDSVDQKQTALFVQSDLDLHWPEKLLVLSSSVRKEMNMSSFQYFWHDGDDKSSFFPNNSICPLS